MAEGPYVCLVAFSEQQKGATRSVASVWLRGREATNVFDLLGRNENDISSSVAWVLGSCRAMLNEFLKAVGVSESIKFSDVAIRMQEFDRDGGITDVEITDNQHFFLIVEAKRGWTLPRRSQLEMYAARESFCNSPAKSKSIVIVSECSRDFIDHHLDINSIDGIPVKHVSWGDFALFAEQARARSSNYEKRLLQDLIEYLKGAVRVQDQTSNEVFVVSLGLRRPEGCSIGFLDVVQQKKRYFHPVGNRWPKQPPNYIAFRYFGKLQSIHHIAGYVITKNLHTEIPEWKNSGEHAPHFVYELGPAIVPQKEVRTGNIFRAGRVWCHIDTLLTCDTISEAVELTKERKRWAVNR